MAAIDKRSDDEFGFAIFGRLSRIYADIGDVLETLDAREICIDSPILDDVVKCSELIRHKIRDDLCQATLCMVAAVNRDLARREAERAMAVHP